MVSAPKFNAPQEILVEAKPTPIVSSFVQLVEDVSQSNVDAWKDDLDILEDE